MGIKKKNRKPATPSIIVARSLIAIFFSLAIGVPTSCVLLSVVSTTPHKREQPSQFFPSGAQVSIIEKDGVWRQRVPHNLPIKANDFAFVAARDSQSSPTLALLVDDAFVRLWPDGKKEAHEFSSDMSWYERPGLDSFRHGDGLRFAALAKNPMRVVCFDEEAVIVWEHDLEDDTVVAQQPMMGAMMGGFGGTQPDGLKISVRQTSDGMPVIFVHDTSYGSDLYLRALNEDGDVIFDDANKEAGTPRKTGIGFVWMPVQEGLREADLITLTQRGLQLNEYELNVATDNTWQLDLKRSQSLNNLANAGHYSVSTMLTPEENWTLLQSQDVYGYNSSAQPRGDSRTRPIDPTVGQNCIGFERDQPASIRNQNQAMSFEVIDKEGYHLANVTANLYFAWNNTGAREPEVFYLQDNGRSIYYQGNTLTPEFDGWPHNAEHILEGTQRISSMDIFFLPSAVLLAYSVSTPDKLIFYVIEKENTALTSAGKKMDE